MSTTDLGVFQYEGGFGGGGGGGGGGSVGSSGNVAIGSGVTSIAVTYTVPGSYNPVFSFENTTDTSPIFLMGFISAQSTSGFTVKFNAPTDTANYSINYSAAVNS
jgi:hypothetical protein